MFLTPLYVVGSETEKSWLIFNKSFRFRFFLQEYLEVKMEQFYRSAYAYGTIISELEYDWGEIRNQLDEIAEEYADYSEDYYAELELWKQPTIEFEEWLSENRGIGFEQEREIYYDLKKLDQIIALYQDAQIRTGWFNVEFGDIEKQVNYLTSQIY